MPDAEGFWSNVKGGLRKRMTKKRSVAVFSSFERGSYMVQESGMAWLGLQTAVASGIANTGCTIEVRCHDLDAQGHFDEVRGSVATVDLGL